MPTPLSVSICQNGPKRVGGASAEQVGEPRGGGLAVAGGDDRVVELQGHGSSLPPSGTAGCRAY